MSSSTAVQERPWANLPSPEVVAAPIENVRLTRDNDGCLQFKTVDDVVIGEATWPALRDLSTRLSFPVDFVQKLNPDLQVAVVNDRIASARRQEFSFLVEDSQVLDIAPGWREANGHGTLCDAALEEVTEIVGDNRLDIRFHHADIGMNLKLVTPVQAPITPAVGDILTMGIEVGHRYGMELGVNLFTERLVCTNGMRAQSRDYNWVGNTAGTAAEQINWLRDGVRKAAESFTSMVERARVMADTRVNGDVTQAIRQRMRVAGIPQRFLGQVLEAYNEEPGDTEWHFLNALTRFATHRADARISHRIQLAAGIMIETFDMVTATLPRSIAQIVGAHIIADEPALETAELVSA